MRKVISVMWGAALLSASTSLTAAGFDGSVPLLCALTDTVSCDGQGGCTHGPAAAVNLPVFVSVDAQKKTAQSTRKGGEQRTSQILSVHKEAGALVLLGVEESGGWSASIGEETGSLTLTVAKEGMGYIVFGACMPQ